MSLLLFFLVSINVVFVLPIPALGTIRLANPMHFDLIHRHSPQLMFSRPITRIERVNDLVHNDNVRVEIISRKVGKRGRSRSRRLTGSSPVIPILSGAYTGTGQYFVKFNVGTPSQKFLLVADTGSDLTWMNCRYRCDNCTRRISKRRIFNAHRSKSFRPISCSTEICKSLPFSLAECSTPTTPCEYDYRYADGSTTHGIFARETITIGQTNGRKMRLKDVVIGCSSSLVGSSFRAADGVLGLGYSNNSFVLKAGKFGNKFSYCLVDHLSPKNVSSYLTFGPSSSEHGEKSGSEKIMSYTPLILGVINGFYPVSVLGISIGGLMLPIPKNIWDLKGEGGVIIDSGTSLTFLAEPAYQMVMAALKLPLMVFKPVDIKPFEFCFNSLGFNEALVPKLVIHFDNSADFAPPVKSYVIDVSDDVKCLGFMSNGWPEVSIIGNIMQQNFLWEFDIDRKRLGFVESTCK